MPNTQSVLEEIMMFRAPRVAARPTVWDIERHGANVIIPTAFEPDPTTYRGKYYYNAVTNILYMKIVTRREPGVVVAHWQKVSSC